MPACRNPQHEQFARNLAEEYLRVPPCSTPEQEAYKRAGYSAHRGNPHRLARRPEIKARFDELMAQARELADVSLARSMVRVDRIADAKLTDFYERIDGDRLARIRPRDITNLPARLAEAIEEVEFNDDGTLKRIKLHDKLAANVALLRVLGGMPDERPTQQVNILNALSPEDQRMLADALEQLGKAVEADANQS